MYTGTADDTTLPTIASAVPFNGATNVGINVAPGVVFNKAIDPVSVNSSTFTVTSNATNPATVLAGSYWFSSNDTRVQFVPNTALPVGANLTMTLNGVLDQVGHPVNLNSSFTAGRVPDYTTPTIVSSTAAVDDELILAARCQRRGWHEASNKTREPPRRVPCIGGSDFVRERRLIAGVSDLNSDHNRYDQDPPSRPLCSRSR